MDGQRKHREGRGKEARSRLHDRLDGRALVAGNLLLDVDDGDEGRQRDAPVRQVAEQCRLADAVAADEAVVHAVVEREHRRIEQLLLARAHADAADADV